MAVEHRGSPTVILAKTVKGWTLGAALEARNATHQIKDLDADELKKFRDRLYLPISDAELEDGDPPYVPPGHRLARVRVPDGAPARARRPMPERVVRRQARRAAPPDAAFADFLAGTGEKVQASTTTAFARMLRNLLRDPGIGQARRADHPGRGAHVRARRAVPRDEDLRTVRADLRAGRRGAAPVVPRGARPVASSRRGSPRPARWPARPPRAPRTRRGVSR